MLPVLICGQCNSTAAGPQVNRWMPIVQTGTTVRVDIELDGVAERFTCLKYSCSDCAYEVNVLVPEYFQIPQKVSELIKELGRATGLEDFEEIVARVRQMEEESFKKQGGK